MPLLSLPGAAGAGVQADRQARPERPYPVVGVGRPNGNHKHRFLARRVGREEVRYCVVIEGQPGGPKPHGVGSQINPAADDASQGLGSAVAARTELPLNQRQVGGDERHGGGIGRQGLFKSQVPGGFPELAFLEARRPL